MKHIFPILLDLLFPRRCPLCDNVLPFKNNFICTSCKDSLSPSSLPSCFKCGRRLLTPEQKYCKPCLKHLPTFDRGFSLWEYNSTVKASISRFKYKGRREYAHYYSEELFRHFSFLFSSSKISAIIPVPIHKKRRNQRGYNQAEVLASLLSQKSEIPLITDLLIRRKNTLPQNQLDFSHRKQNLTDAFSINQNSSFYKIHLPSILLIDDIYTTGSTANICSSLLKSIGVTHVYILCLASTNEK